jgi:hypothetical protein
MCETKLAHLMCPVDRSYPLPPRFHISERAMYTKCRGTIPQYTVSLSLCLVTHWFSPHHHHVHHQLHFPSSSSLRKVSWTFLGCRYVCFPTRSLGCLELHSNSSLSILGASYKVQPPAWPSWEQYDLSGLEPDGPPWVSLVLNAFGHLFRGPAFRLTVPRISADRVH